jgi:hypothetical protein
MRQLYVSWKKVFANWGLALPEPCSRFGSVEVPLVNLLLLASGGLPCMHEDFRWRQKPPENFGGWDVCRSTSWNLAVSGWVAPAVLGTPYFSSDILLIFPQYPA